MNKVNTTKKVYQIWLNVPSWLKKGETESIVYKECETLTDMGYFQYELIKAGYISWFQIVENNDK